MLEKDICQELNKSRKSKARDGLQLDNGGWNAGHRRQSLELTWTNFHCALCLGVGGFVLFWIFLLARMYLPVENALMAWWLGKDSATVGPTEGNFLEVTSEQSN